MNITGEKNKMTWR